VIDTNSWKVVYTIPGETKCFELTTELMLFEKKNMEEDDKSEIGLLNFTHHGSFSKVPAQKIAVMPISFIT
jgi:hypothetical protein